MMVLVSTDTGFNETQHSTEMHLSNTPKHCRSSPTALLTLGMYLINYQKHFL